MCIHRGTVKKLVYISTYRHKETKGQDGEGGSRLVGKKSSGHKICGAARRSTLRINRKPCLYAVRRMGTYARAVERDRDMRVFIAGPVIRHVPAKTRKLDAVFPIKTQPGFHYLRHEGSLCANNSFRLLVPYIFFATEVGCAVRFGKQGNKDNA